MKKSKKPHAIAPAALGSCGGLGQLWRSSGRPWESSGRLYIEKNSRSTAPAAVMFCNLPGRLLGGSGLGGLLGATLGLGGSQVSYLGLGGAGLGRGAG